MKNLVYTFLCFILIGCYTIRPVIPFIDYLIRKDFIEKNLCEKREIRDNCCHGKCYLDKQLAKTQEENPIDKENNHHNNQNLKVDDHLITGTIQVIPDEKKICGFFDFDVSLVVSYHEPVFIPPKS
jgi:hypothetical protein